jgi:hypothetical protein
VLLLALGVISILKGLRGRLELFVIYGVSYPTLGLVGVLDIAQLAVALAAVGVPVI